MDKGMDRIAEDMKGIVETRAEIANKLEKLEQCFTSSVDEAKMMAENFAIRTQSVIDDTMDSFKEVTDPSRLLSHHPWMMVSGAIMIGVALGRVFKEEGRGVIPYDSPNAQGTSVMSSSGSASTTKEGVYSFYPHASDDGSSRTTSSHSATASSIFTYLGPVIAEGLGQVKQDLVEVGKAALRAWLKEAVQGVGRNVHSARDRQAAETKVNRKTRREDGDHPQEPHMVEA